MGEHPAKHALRHVPASAGPGRTQEGSSAHPSGPTPRPLGHPWVLPNTGSPMVEPGTCFLLPGLVHVSGLGFTSEGPPDHQCEAGPPVLSLQPLSALILGANWSCASGSQAQSPGKGAPSLSFHLCVLRTSPAGAHNRGWITVGGTKQHSAPFALPVQGSGSGLQALRRPPLCRDRFALPGLVGRGRG